MHTISSNEEVNLDGLEVICRAMVKAPCWGEFGCQPPELFHNEGVLTNQA